MIWIKISALIVGVSIAILSLMPPSSGVQLSVNDKVGHFIAYAVWMINVGLFVKQNHYWKIFVALIAFSGLMEFFQGMVPGREVSMYDILANTIGALIGIVVLVVLKPYIIHLLVKLKIVRVKD